MISRFLGIIVIFFLCCVHYELDAHAFELSEITQQVTIHRDQWGVPHVFGKTDESTIFGFGYVQAEDFFWQVEDSYILALGRYAEVHGPRGLNSDLLNRAFEIVPRSQRDFAALDATSQRLYTAFVQGINFFLSTHPEVRPRLVRHFEPWHVLAFHRHIALELCYRSTGLSDSYLPRRNPYVWTASGSNGWAISGSRTMSGHPMLLCNPHMPWYGFTQLMEAHLRSEEKNMPWNFSGAGFYGSPSLAMGHNEHLGWTLVTNQPDIADVWRVKFTHPDRPLAYQYNDDWREAESWDEFIRVRKSRGIETRKHTFRKTHHGPIVAQEDDQTFLAARISGLFEVVPMRQSMRMIKAHNLAEFRNAVSELQLLYMNILYADCDGNIWYLYNARLPRRNPQFDWSAPVDGSDPAAEWLGFHTLDELPQVLNPAAGFVQNCNSSPLITTDGDNPQAKDFPAYMIGEIGFGTGVFGKNETGKAVQYRRRALRSLEILRATRQTTFEDWQAAAFDTEVYWARNQLPHYAAHLEQLEQDNRELAQRVRPYLEHLLAWDARITADSTAATLCHAWYEQLYGAGYPGETMRAIYEGKPAKQLARLERAAEALIAMHGSWKVPYTAVYRIQRQPHVADLVDLRFDDRARSLPSLGGHGPMGVVFTQYYSPSLDIPWVISQRQRYGLVGTSYLATYEFVPDGVRSASLVPLGTSGNPASPHYFDQATLLSERRLKPAHFTKQDVVKNSQSSYHPGE